MAASHISLTESKEVTSYKKNHSILRGARWLHRNIGVKVAALPSNGFYMHI